MFREKDLLNEMSSQYVIKLIATTLDDQNLYFVFENCENGDLASLIAAKTKFSLQVTKMYAAQIVQALCYLQSLDIMHRDLKPQNILLDQDMNIKIVGLFNRCRSILVTPKR